MGITPILQRSLRLRETKGPDQGHTGNEWQSRDSNPAQSTPTSLCSELAHRPSTDSPITPSHSQADLLPNPSSGPAPQASSGEPQRGASVLAARTEVPEGMGVGQGGEGSCHPSWCLILQEMTHWILPFPLLPPVREPPVATRHLLARLPQYYLLITVTDQIS